MASQIFKPLSKFFSTTQVFQRAKCALAEKLLPAGSNFSAKAHLALWKTCVVEKNFDKGLKIWEAMKPLMINLEQGGKFIQSIKYATSLRGIKSEQVRMPLQGLNDEEKLGLRNIIEDMNLKIEKIMNE